MRAANSLAEPRTLGLILAAVIMFAGTSTLASWRDPLRTALESRPKAQRALLTAIGAVAGSGSGLTGVGGPALSVPLMMTFGFPTLISIATSQVIQIVAASAGMAANLNSASSISTWRGPR